MKKHNIGIKTVLTVFAGLLTACSSDNDIVDNNPVNPEKPVANSIMTFSASMDAENTTRTDFNSNSTIWAKGDAIQVLNTATITDPNEPSLNNGVFSIVESTDENYIYTKEEKFTGPSIGANGNDNDQFYAFYPSTVTTSTTSGVKMSAEVPTIQTAMEGTYNQTLHFMTAHSTNSNFNFKNVCALLKITLSSSDICRVKVVANPTLSAMNAQDFTYTSIAGNFEATVNTDGIATTTSTEAKKTYVELRAANDDGTATTAISAGTYYMVVLPATINGFTILLEKTDGTIYQRVNTKITSFARNQMYNLGSYNTGSMPTGVTALANVVDLDLPSGTLWTTSNLLKNGTFESSEYGYGDYYTWGKESVWEPATYLVFKPTRVNNTLKGKDDVAYSKTNQVYCMPVFAQICELYYNFDDNHKESNTGSGNKGAKFTAATGRHIWLPYTGHYFSLAGIQRLRQKDEKGAYWTRNDAGTGGVGNYNDSYTLDIMEGTVNGKKVPVPDDHSGLNGAHEWSDDPNTGRAIRPVATNIKIAPIMN